MIPNLAVATWTRHDLCDRMLRSVDVEVGHLLVVDNGGGFRVPDGPWGRVTVLPMPVNFGVGPSWNLAFKCLYEHDVVFVTADDVTFPAGTLSRLAEVASAETLTLSGTWPHWCLFAAGQRFLERVGLFDERLFPAYHEDKELEWRAGLLGGGIVTSDVHVEHDNAATLRTPGRQFGPRKVVTEDRNGRLVDNKRNSGDTSTGWSAYRWREQAW